jgi:uncharacterized protein
MADGDKSADPLPPPGPVTPRERIFTLDVLRGFGVLGILVMNVQFFAMIGAAYTIPTAYGDLGGVNYAAWYLGALLADLKFMAIFSMLFGAGIVLTAERQQAAGRAPLPFHLRRMGVLLLFGVLHAYLLFPGDILYTYALVGLAVYLFRRLGPGVLLLLGLVVLGVGSGMKFSSYTSMSSWSPEERAELTRELRPPPDKVAEEVAAYRSGWEGEFRLRCRAAWWVQTEEFFSFLAWRTGGLMLLGMALYKAGVLTGSRPRRTYRALAAVAVAVGLPVTAYGIHRNEASGWDPGYVLYAGSQYNYWASLLVALGWVGVVVLASRSARLGFLNGALAAVGRMALTNYLMQSLICTTIFHGHGLGMFGRVERVGQLGIVVGVWAVQLLLSPLWLRYFRFGPAEWLWRSLTYGKVQPMLRTSPGEPSCVSSRVPSREDGP